MVATRALSAPLAVVVGATGAQGGSVLSHLLASDRSYRLRGITRNPVKPASQALAARGVDMVAGDLGSATSIARAFDGADYIFAVTDYWASRSAGVELAEGKTLVDAAKACGVKLFVWSGLEAVSKVSGGKYHVAHFDSKAAVTDYARNSGVPLSIVMPGYYATNFLGMKPRLSAHGDWIMSLPASESTKLPILNTERDFGAYVRAVIESPKLGAGSEVLAAPAYVTLQEVVQIWSKVTGLTIRYKELPAAQDHGNERVQMLQFFGEFGYFAGKDLGLSQAGLAAPTQTFAEFARDVDWLQLWEE